MTISNIFVTTHWHSYLLWLSCRLKTSFITLQVYTNQVQSKGLGLLFSTLRYSTDIIIGPFNPSPAFTPLALVLGGRCRGVPILISA